jgi:hypothetical protein
MTGKVSDLPSSCAGHSVLSYLWRPVLFWLESLFLCQEGNHLKSPMLIILWGFHLRNHGRVLIACPVFGFRTGSVRMLKTWWKINRKKQNTKSQAFRGFRVLRRLLFVVDHRMTGALITQDPLRSMELWKLWSQGSSHQVQQWYHLWLERIFNSPLFFSFSFCTFPPSPEAPLMGLRIKISPKWLI